MREFCKDCKHFGTTCIKGLEPRVSSISGLTQCNSRELKRAFVWGKHIDGKRY